MVAGRQPSIDRIARQELQRRICAAITGSPRAPTNGGKCSTTAGSDQRGVRQDFIRPLQAGTERTPGELQWTTAQPVLARPYWLNSLNDVRRKIEASSVDSDHERADRSLVESAQSGSKLRA